MNLTDIVDSINWTELEAACSVTDPAILAQAHQDRLRWASETDQYLAKIDQWINESHLAHAPACALMLLTVPPPDFQPQPDNPLVTQGMGHIIKPMRVYQLMDTELTDSQWLEAISVVRQDRDVSLSDSKFLDLIVSTRQLIGDNVEYWEDKLDQMDHLDNNLDKAAMLLLLAALQGKDDLREGHEELGHPPEYLEITYGMRLGVMLMWLKDCANRELASPDKLVP